jgi:hypothetical protein
LQLEVASTNTSINLYCEEESCHLNNPCMIVSPVEVGEKPFSIHGCHNTSADLQQLVAEIRRKKSVLP